MEKRFWVLGLLLAAMSVEAKPAVTGENFSGTYVCKGNNEQVGDYQVTAVLRLNRISSYGKFGAYDFSTETDNAVTYKGQAVADGYRLALSYRLTQGKDVEYSTGIAEMRKVGKNRWAYRNSYYEPDDNGGNYGNEYCEMPALKAVRSPKSIQRRGNSN